MWRRLRAAMGPILVLIVFLAVVFLFLGLEMSSPYTRAGPECSVWCVLEHKIQVFFGLKEAGSLE